MGFPAVPINGQTVTVNGVLYIYASGSNSWTRQPNQTITASAYYYTNAESPGYVYVLDDIGTQFNGSIKQFTIKISGSTYSVNNPNQLTIVIGNNNVYPAKFVADYQYLPEVSTFDQGFTVSGSTITFATPPSPNMSFYGTVRTNQDLMPTFSYVQTPFRALNIMLGA